MKITPAAVSAWLDCRRRHRFMYVDRPRPRQTGGPWAHFGLGNSVHAALAAWHDTPGGEDVDGHARRLVTQHWVTGGYQDAGQEAAYREAATGWVAAYAPTGFAGVRLGTERVVSCKVDDTLVLEGRVDRADQRDGRITIVDYKVGKRAPTDDDASASHALAVYVLAAGRMWRTRCDRAELHHVPTGAVATVTYTRATLMRQIDRVRDVANDVERVRQDFADNTGGVDPATARAVADDLYPTNPGPQCASCPFRTVCPDGQAAAPTPPVTWAYLPPL